MTEAIPFHTAEQCIHDRFDKVASIIPDHPAVSDEKQTLSYQELLIQSNKMAHSIIATLGNGNSNIGLLIDNNIYQVIAILGILKSGRSYVPLDPGFPPERNKLILEDAGCKILLCSSGTVKQAEEIAGEKHLLLADKLSLQIPESKPQTKVLPESNAITLYTSGSTGKPKGVLQSHRNMVHFIKRMTELYPFLPDDKVAYFLSVAFSAHALPLLGALLNGCELKMHSFKSGNFLDFSRWMQTSGISFAMMIPSFLRHFLSAQDKKDKYPDLRLLMLGGETLYRSDVEKARKVFHSSIEMVNIYASTEAYLMRSFSIKRDTILKTNIVPIGYPVEGMDIAIRGNNNKKTGTKEEGEIILSSKYLTGGYWKRPDMQERDFSISKKDESIRVFKTADSAYLLEDGCMVHTGRKDAVIKLRGYRIDFGEIINILLQNNEVTEAACTLKKDGAGTEHIIAYVVVASKVQYDPELSKAMLVRLLPDYMIPSHIVEVDELPKNSSGKLDIGSLPEPSWVSSGSDKKEKPSNEIEAALVAIFEKVLKISPIGTNENFLKIGANSLGLFVAFSEVEKKFNVKIGVKTTIENPSIKSLAALISQQ